MCDDDTHTGGDANCAVCTASGATTVTCASCKDGYGLFTDSTGTVDVTSCVRK